MGVALENVGHLLCCLRGGMQRLITQTKRSRTRLHASLRKPARRVQLTSRIPTLASSWQMTVCCVAGLRSNTMTWACECGRQGCFSPVLIVFHERRGIFARPLTMLHCHCRVGVPLQSPFARKENSRVGGRVRVDFAMRSESRARSCCDLRLFAPDSRKHPVQHRDKRFSFKIAWGRGKA